jgi:hypothetical protein
MLKDIVQIDKEFLIDGQSVIDIVVVVVVEILVFDMIQHTEGVDIYLGGCCWCDGVLVELVDVEDIVVLRS